MNMHWLFGLTNAPWWVMVIYVLVMAHITMVSITVYLHRHQAHRALELHPMMAHFFRFWLWFTTGMKTKEWVAVHRKHHAFSDRVGDPHSPVVEGLSSILWEGADHYRMAKKDPEMLEKYGKGTPADWLERHAYHARFLRGKLGVILLYVLDVVLFGTAGIIVWGVQMAWTPFFAAGVINGIGHFFGYRNFECADAATNIVPWGILIAGEELHNNHHAYGTSAKLSVKPWEFDIGWMYICMMSAVGLATVKRLPPQVERVSTKQEVDMDTVKAIVVNRLQILSRYSKDVIKPVLRHERKATCDRDTYRSLSRRLKLSLVRNQALVQGADRQHMERVLAKHRRLQDVYHYREKFQDIWSRTTASQKELLEALQEWCHQAEHSGIEALQHFVKYIRTYQLKKAHSPQ